MAQTLTQLFGPSATRNGNAVTFNADDFSSVGLSGNNPTPSQIFAALIMWFEANNASAIDDPTAGVSPSGFSSDPSKIKRGSSNQLVYPYSINVYRSDPTFLLDPDDVL